MIWKVKPRHQFNKGRVVKKYQPFVLNVWFSLSVILYANGKGHQNTSFLTSISIHGL